MRKAGADFIDGEAYVFFFLSFSLLRLQFPGQIIFDMTTRALFGGHYLFIFFVFYLFVLQNCGVCFARRVFPFCSHLESPAFRFP